MARRRAHLISESPKSGTILFELLARLPVIESFGFETDI